MGRVKPEFKKRFNPLLAPFQIGDIVCKGVINRPFDIGMRYRVAGLYYSGSGNGWQATIALGEQPVQSRYIDEEYETVSTGRLCLVARHEDYELAKGGAS